MWSFDLRPVRRAFGRRFRSLALLASFVVLASMSVSAPVRAAVPAEGRAVASVLNSEGRVVLFMPVGLGYGQDRVVVRAQTAPGAPTWTDPVLLDGSVHTLAAAHNADDRILLAAVSNDGAISWRLEERAGTSVFLPWQQLDGTAASIALAENQDGTVLMAVTNNAGQIFVRRQTEAGAGSWTDWSAVDGQLRYVSAVTGADKNVHLVGVNSTGDVWYRRQSAPNAEQWTNWFSLGTSPGQVAVGANSDGSLELIRPGVNLSRGRLLASSCTSCPPTWSQWQPFDGGLTYLSLVRNADGKMLVTGTNWEELTWQRQQSAPSSQSWEAWEQLSPVMSDKLGADINTPDREDYSGQSNAVTIDSDGKPAIVYMTRSGARQELRLARCHDVTCSSSTISVIDSGDFNNPSIVIGTDGLPVISYADYPAGGLRVAHCGDRACAGVTIETVDGAGEAYVPAITIGGDGLPMISFLDGYYTAKSAVKVAHCLDVACNSSRVRTIDTVSSQGLARTSITTGPDGLAYLAYHDGLGGFTYDFNLKFARCSDADCSSVTTKFIDSVGKTGGYPSIAIGVDGFPVIAYDGNFQDDGSTDLMVARCMTVYCSSAVIRTVDSGGTTGVWPTVRIGRDNLPVISYFNYREGDFRVAHCSDITCFTSERSVVYKAGPSSGTIYWQNSSMAIGRDGLPFITANDVPNGDLKTVHCINNWCAQ